MKYLEKLPPPIELGKAVPSKDDDELDDSTTECEMTPIYGFSEQQVTDPSLNIKPKKITDSTETPTFTEPTPTTPKREKTKIGF